jgi:endoribonuclease Dicer
MAALITPHRHTWYPEGLAQIKGRDLTKKLLASAKHHLAEKTIADVCEALIGASVLSGGAEHRFDMAVKAVTILVDNQDHEASTWKDYLSIYTMPKYQTQNVTGFEIELARLVEEKVGYRFNYPRLLHSAFTHPSFPAAWATVPCYQRLEFLGDSLFDMVCVEDLFARYPDRDPQWLTEHKVGLPCWFFCEEGY